MLFLKCIRNYNNYMIILLKRIIRMHKNKYKVLRSSYTSIILINLKLDRTTANIEFL